MAVLYRPTLRARERILAGGKEGAGKTKAMIDVMKREFEVSKDSASNFYIIDNDNAWERLLETEGLDPDHPKIHLTLAFDWQDNVAAMKEYRKEVGRDDWLVVDFYGRGWDLVQEFFVEEGFGEDPTEFYINMRAKNLEAAAKGQKQETFGGAYGLNWQAINKTYTAAWVNPILQIKGHVYCTTETRPLNDETDDNETRLAYSAFGVKPGGQRRIGHLFSTLLLFSRTAAGYQITTWGKDRGREMLKSKKWKDFSEDYLGNVAGWKMQVSE